MCFIPGGKPSGKEISDRKTKVLNQLQDSFIEQEGSEVRRDIVFSSLGLESDYYSNSFVTRAIKEVFPNVTLKRNRKDNLYPF